MDERPTLKKKAQGFKRKQPEVEYFLKALSDDVIKDKLGPILNRTLQNYRTRKLRWEMRAEQVRQ